MLIIDARHYFNTKLDCKEKYIWRTIYEFKELKFQYILKVFISLSCSSGGCLDGQTHLASYHLMLFISKINNLFLL